MAIFRLLAGAVVIGTIFAFSTKGGTDGAIEAGGRVANRVVDGMAGSLATHAIENTLREARGTLAASPAGGEPPDGHSAATGTLRPEDRKLPWRGHARTR